MGGPVRHHIGPFGEKSGRLNDKIVEETLYLAVQYSYAAQVFGHVAEFGTMTGNTACAIASAIRDFDGTNGIYRRFLLFDSFQGLPELTSPNDLEGIHAKTGVWTEGLCVDLNPEALERRLQGYLAAEKIDIRPGWFKRSAVGIADTLAVIHIDCDLYSSTMDVLLPLFKNKVVSSGAIILFDDWNCNQADPYIGERAAWAKLNEEFNIEFSDEGSYGIVGHKFIIHSYKEPTYE